MKKTCLTFLGLELGSCRGELRGENRIEEVLEKNDKQGRDQFSLEFCTRTGDH